MQRFQVSAHHIVDVSFRTALLEPCSFSKSRCDVIVKAQHHGNSQSILPLAVHDAHLRRMEVILLKRQTHVEYSPNRHRSAGPGPLQSHRSSGVDVRTSKTAIVSRAPVVVPRFPSSSAAPELLKKKLRLKADLTHDDRAQDDLDDE